MAARKLTLANNPLLSGPPLAERQRGGVPYREIPISAVERDQNQPRVIFDDDRLAELAASIKSYGVLSPIIVRPGKVPGKYQLISGERRLRASKLAGLASIPAMVDAKTGEGEERLLAIQLVENLQRADLTPLERAHAIGALRDTYGISIREIATKLSVSKSMVQRSLEILELPDDLLNALREGVAESKILMLAKITDEAVRASFLRDIDSFTRDALKRELGEKSSSSERKSPGVTRALSAEDERIADEIQRALGLKVRMSRSSAENGAGRLLIDFYSDEDLRMLFRKLLSDN